MKIILTGATGTAGSEVLRQALVDSSIEKICVLSRRALDVQHAKLEVILMQDFLDYSQVLPRIAGFDACLWCLGISQNAVDAEEYVKITYDYALAGAQAMGFANSSLIFCFLSGSGADSKEKSRILFARIKGKTENALSELRHPRTYHFRPGYIHPTTVKPKRAIEKIIEPLTPLFYKFLPGSIISTVELAQAMIKVAKTGASKTILENNDIREIVRHP